MLRSGATGSIGLALGAGGSIGVGGVGVGDGDDRVGPVVGNSGEGVVVVVPERVGSQGSSVVELE